MSTIPTVAASLQPNYPVKTSGKSLPVPAGKSSGREIVQNLASSIMADGGLGFLQSRLEDKLNSMFVSASEAGGSSGEISAALSYGTSMDTSPKATAGRIVGLALGLMDTYRRQNNSLSDKDLRAGFESEIRRGISQGFDHAKGVLDGMELLEGETESNVASTWDRVQELLDDHFREAA